MGRKSGLYWHVHHDKLLEWCWDYDERVAFIKHNKSSREIEPRLRLMQPVQGELPEAVAEARKAYDEVGKAYAPEINALHAKECPDEE
jgi:hypothetical protein